MIRALTCPYAWTTLRSVKRCEVTLPWLRFHAGHIKRPAIS
jgi:hypothetical protein